MQIRRAILIELLTNKNISSFQALKGKLSYKIVIIRSCLVKVGDKVT
ncbi:MAG: hypothetical protein ACD_20C00002G0001, partial [uncultured bacterium]